MKSFFVNYIKIPKYGTVREKVFMTRISLGLTFIIFCMAALTYSAYAYFSHSVTSDTYKITPASYSLNYTVYVGDKRPNGELNFVEEAQTVRPSDLDGTYRLEPGVYTIEMIKPDTATASTGFCRIEICDINGNKVTYYTEQIGKVSATESVITRHILVEIKDHAAFVKLAASWGTCARVEQIISNSQLEFTATGNSNTETTERGEEQESEQTPEDDENQLLQEPTETESNKNIE
ncbi:MAG: hypothetical protein J6Q76_07055 [Clostridia bacterium]|nr:hypothetical protein [Clostridia bacterium]